MVVPGFMLPLVILLEFGGGLAILFGFLTRTTAPVYCGLYAAGRHFYFTANFGRRHEPLMSYEKPDYFWRIPAAGNSGPGAFSIDRPLNKKR